jgi:hypothetical protein
MCNLKFINSKLRTKCFCCDQKKYENELIFREPIPIFPQNSYIKSKPIGSGSEGNVFLYKTRTEWFQNKPIALKELTRIDSKENIIEIKKNVKNICFHCLDKHVEEIRQ